MKLKDIIKIANISSYELIDMLDDLELLDESDMERIVIFIMVNMKE